MTIQTPRQSSPRTTRLSDDLGTLHAHYVVGINDAVAADDEALIAELVASYEREALLMVATREGRLDQLSLFEQTRPTSAPRWITRRFAGSRAA